MDVRLFLRMLLCSGLLLSASCTSNDLGPARPGDGRSTDRDVEDEDEEDEDDEDEEGTTAGRKDAGRKDAGRKDAGRKDAGRKDAGSADDEEGEDEEEEPVDEGEEPVTPAPRPTTPARDGGGATTTPPATRSDAGSPPPPPPPTDLEPGEIGATPGGNGSTPTSGCSDVTYEGFVQPLFAMRCIGCHSAGSMVREDLTKVENISRLRDNIRERVGGMNPLVPRMPPGPPLSDSDLSQLGMWFDCLP